MAPLSRRGSPAHGSGRPSLYERTAAAIVTVCLMTYRVVDRFRLLWELWGLMEWKAL
jgi:hypothetical protein